MRKFTKKRKNCVEGFSLVVSPSVNYSFRFYFHWITRKSLYFSSLPKVFALLHSMHTYNYIYVCVCEYVYVAKLINQVQNSVLI